MKLSFTQDELKELRLEMLAEYTTELAYLAGPRSSSTPAKPKTPRSRSPDPGDFERRKKAKFIVEEEEESDSESEFEDLYYESELEDSLVYPSPPQLSSSASSSSSSTTTSTVTRQERYSATLVRSRACTNLRAGFDSRASSHSPQTPFSPTIEVPIVDPNTTLENFTKTSAAGWQLLQWFKSSPWVAARR